VTLCGRVSDLGVFVFGFTVFVVVFGKSCP